MKISNLKIIFLFIGLTFAFCKISSQKGYQIGYVHFDSKSQHTVLRSYLSSNGIQGGITYDIKLKELIYLHTAGLYSMNYKGSEIMQYYSIDNSISIPIQFTFIIPRTPDFETFVFTGPTLRGSPFEFGRWKTSNSNETPYFFDIDAPFKTRITIFWGIGIGFKRKDIYIKGNYDWGLLNPYKGVRSDSFSIALGKVY